MEHEIRFSDCASAEMRDDRDNDGDDVDDADAGHDDNRSLAYAAQPTRTIT